ncbi:site-specific integrase [Acrocarpospora sp. B8E8]|uniref:tyrosine-type recombinase/integrase n=1 Tax=Acrocarpospora sp. B8E8 TaxID=3153572 RepID=UPI00325E142E
MAHVEDRWMRKARDPDGQYIYRKGKPVMERDPNRYGKGKRWRLRYIGPDGKELNESFEKKVDAENRKSEVEVDLLKGTYINPNAGKVTFRKQAEEVIENRTLDPSTRVAMRQRLAKHVYPVIGSKEIGLLSRRPSIMQALVKKLDATLAPSYVKVVMAHVQLVFGVAVSDELIAKNPASDKNVILPSVVTKKLVPWTAGQVLDMRDALPECYQATIEAGAGIGLRQGEIFGFSPDDVDWIPGVVHVQRQLKLLKGKLVFAPPKGGKSRDVPLSEDVKVALSEHVRTIAPITVTLPWRDVDGPPCTVRLFFGNREGRAVHPVSFLWTWHRALEAAGIVPKAAAGESRDPAYRKHGMHMLRHYFASSLLTGGETIQAVSEWLGHHDPAFTLRVYVHLMPSSEQRMRKIIDAALRRPEIEDHGPEAAQGRPR